MTSDEIQKLRDLYAKATVTELYVGAQNDALYLIDKRPSLSGDDRPWHDREAKVVAKVYDGKDAGPLAAAFNALPGLLNEMEKLRSEAREFKSKLVEPYSDCSDDVPLAVWCRRLGSDLKSCMILVSAYQQRRVFNLNDMEEPLAQAILTLGQLMLSIERARGPSSD